MKKYYVKLIPYEEIYTLEVQADSSEHASDLALMYLNDGNDAYCVNSVKSDDVLVHSVEEKAA